MSQQNALSLDADLGTFRNDLTQASELVVRLYERLDQARITPAKTRSEIASLFDEPLPEEPQSMASIFSEVETKVFANSTLYLSPRFSGYIDSGGNQASILGELLGSAVNHDRSSSPNRWMGRTEFPDPCGLQASLGWNSTFHRERDGALL